MSVSPEQQLRAYVEYFRDLGVYELYQRESPQVVMLERWRELLARPKAATAQTRVLLRVRRERCRRLGLAR